MNTDQCTHNKPQFYSARQRVVVVTFATPAAAAAWDAAGRPLGDLLAYLAVEVDE